MKSIRIFYIAFGDETGTKILVGGIQNYIKCLHEISTKAGYDCQIYQYGKSSYQSVIEGVKVHCLQYKKSNNVKKAMSHIFQKFSKNFDENDIIIWGSDTLAVKVRFKNVIAIQHGITFDLIYYKNLSNLWQKNYFGKIYKQLQCLKARRNFLIAPNVVCVDYNYQNWVRTQLPRKICDKISVIPNFAIPSEGTNINKISKEKIKILFARRFSFERGVEIMIEVVENILSKYDNIEFTFCGNGPYESLLMEKFNDNDNVELTSFGVGESEKFNLSHHISIIPTYGSEGTSFSLLEAMACGAVPIVSNVGGMTNIVINGFNGIICRPTAEDFINCIVELLEDKNRLDIISENAHKTVNEGFTYKIWEKRWINYLNQF